MRQASGSEARPSAFPGDRELVNEDLIPVPLPARTWGYNFTALWLDMVRNIFSFTVIGSMMATGLSAFQALTTASKTTLARPGSSLAKAYQPAGTEAADQLLAAT